MGLFRTARNYASIVAPLTKMREDLINYISEQSTRIDQLNSEKAAAEAAYLKQKAEIEGNIDNSSMEITKSQGTAEKIASLLALDIDEDGTADVDELPTDSTGDETIQM